MTGNYARLSMDQYSSNLIELVIQKAGKGLQKKIIMEIVDSGSLHKVVQS